jgi:hypothetical protein
MKTNSTGASSIALLTILFIALKLMGYISWSWFWVLSPIIFRIAFVLVGIGVLAIVNRKKK